MAYRQELFECSVCLQLLVDPVTTACGHSYCMKCLDTFWDTNNNGGTTYSCPQCRQTFSPRPVLMRNTLLGDLLEEHKKTICQSSADTFAEPGDVPCDVCTGRKRKASTFCLVCLVSYCETHLKPHFEVPPLRKHRLIQASARVKDSVCSRHDKLLEIYCRTDQQYLCVLCVMGEHKNHDTVAVATEMCQMQIQLDWSKQEIADRVLESERKMAELREAADSIRDAAWEASDNFEQLCVEQICFVEKKRSEMRDKIGEVEKAGVDWTNGHLAQLKREVLELRRRQEKLIQLSQTGDPVNFFQGFQALGDPPAFTDLYERPDMLMEFVTAQKDKLKNMCSKEKNEIFSQSEKTLLSAKTPSLEKIPKILVLPKYKNSNVELDPNTVAACLSLSDRNREISWSGVDQAHPEHPDRFTHFNQALCKKGLTGSHYWEVEWDGGVVELAVSYKDIKRKGSGKDCCFGHNNVSWKLTCSSSGCRFWHNNIHKGNIPPVHSRRVGIHLDYEAGSLSFYSVSDPDTLTLLHQIQTTFTKPLYPGFSVDLGSTLKICNI